MFSFQSPLPPLTEANCMDFFPIINVKLTSVQKDTCEGQITEEEHIDAIKAFKSTPRLDGIPVEVHQSLWAYHRDQFSG